MPCALEPDQFARARGLTDPLEHFLSVQAVIQGASPGRVWVDDPTAPSCAFIEAPEGWHLIGQAPDAQFARGVGELYAETILPDGVRSGWRYSCLHCWPAEWGELIAPQIGRWSPRWDYQRFLLLRELRVDWRPLVPEGMKLVPVTREFLESGTRWTEEIRGHGFWSLEDFLARGFGHCMMHEGAIVGSCIADMVVGARTEVGVWTHPEYRRRGLATAVVAASVEHCLARGIRHIGWHCWSPNEASLRTAQRVGFEYVLDHHGFEFQLGEG